MKFTVAAVLDQLSPSESLPAAKLEKALGLTTKADRQTLQIGVEALSRLGLIASDGEGLRRLDAPDLVPARLRCSSKGFCFALREDGGDDVYVRDYQLNHAWNGDRVLVRITRDGGRRRSPEGSVQCILERQTTSMLAQVEQQDERLVAVPLDDRLLTTVELPSGDASHLSDAPDSVVEVHIDRFPVAQFPPQGHVIRSLPMQGGVEADVELLLTKHHLRDRPAPPRATLKTPAAKEREDLTALATLLPEPWQGADAPALPALSLEERQEGWRLWVHAPDVAERLSHGGSLDNWLRERGEAHCLGERWLPLLPPNLARACGFQTGRTQDALSVALDLDAGGELQHYRFCRSTIKPSAGVDAAALEALASRRPRSRTLPAPLKSLKEQLPLLEKLVGLTDRLRQRRLEQGSIDLDLPVPPLERLGDLQVPSPDGTLQGWLIQLPAAHPASLLREALFLAHRALGRHLAALQLPGLFSVNPPAEASAMNDVAKAALSLEITLELGSEGNASGAELAAAFAATDRGRALQQQLRDALQPVHLSSQPGPHAAAGEPVAFASWCCPTLHYVDLWNQQLLVSLLTDGKDRPTVRHRTGVDLAADSCHGSIEWALLTPSQLGAFQKPLAHGLAQRLEAHERALQEFQADAVALAQARDAEPLVGRTLPGVISGVQSYGFFVEVPPSQVEGLVHVSSLKDDWYEYRSRQNRLVGRKCRRVYMMGDRVEVEIQKVDALRHQIDLAVVQPDLPPTGDEAGDAAGSGDS